MSRDDFEKIFNRAIGVSIWSLDSGLRCFECGKPIRISKTYYKNGVRKRYRNYKFVCTNKDNSHKYSYLDYTVSYLDMFEGMSRANENNYNFNGQLIL